MSLSVDTGALRHLGRDDGYVKMPLTVKEVHSGSSNQPPSHYSGTSREQEMGGDMLGATC